MALSSYKTFLMVKEDNDWVELVPIKSAPATGSDPEMLQTTTLKDAQHTYVKGVQSNEIKKFTANYTLADYTAVVAYKDVANTDYAIWYGGTDNASGVATPTGSDGKFTFKGTLDVYVNEMSVDAVKEMTITIVPETPVTLAT